MLQIHTHDTLFGWRLRPRQVIHQSPQTVNEGRGVLSGALLVERVLPTGSLARRSPLVRGCSVTHPVVTLLREAAHGRCRSSPSAATRLAPSHPLGGCARRLPCRFLPDHLPRLGHLDPQAPSDSQPKAPVESNAGAVASGPGWVVPASFRAGPQSRQPYPVSCERSSNPACGFPAPGSRTGFTSRHSRSAWP